MKIRKLIVIPIGVLNKIVKLTTRGGMMSERRINKAALLAYP